MFNKKHRLYENVRVQHRTIFSKYTPKLKENRRILGLLSGIHGKFLVNRSGKIILCLSSSPTCSSYFSHG